MVILLISYGIDTDPIAAVCWVIPQTEELIKPQLYLHQVFVEDCITKISLTVYMGSSIKS